MTARSHLRGHPIEYDEARDEWVYSDTGEPTRTHWGTRACGHCGLAFTADGHDGCLGHMAGVMNACCGHGRAREAYVQLPTGLSVRGTLALLAQRLWPRRAP